MFNILCARVTKKIVCLASEEYDEYSVHCCLWTVIRLEFNLKYNLKNHIKRCEPELG